MSVGLGEPRLSSALLAAIDQRVEELLRRRLPTEQYGVVASIDEGLHMAQVYLDGNPQASPGWHFGGWHPQVGDQVLVRRSPSGDRVILAVVDSSRAHNLEAQETGLGGGSAVRFYDLEGRLRAVVQEEGGTLALGYATGDVAGEEIVEERLLIEPDGNMVVGPIQISPTDLVQVSGRLTATELILPAGAAPSVEGAAEWDELSGHLKVHDGTQLRPVTPVAWLPYALPIGYDMQAATASTGLAATSSVLMPVHLPAPMLLQACSVQNHNTSIERSWEWRLYRDSLTIDEFGDEVAGANGSETFTPSAISTRTAAAAGAPVILAPGAYTLVIRNSHATNVFAIGTVAAGAEAVGGSRAKTKTLAAALADGLDLNTGWAATTLVYAARLSGRIRGVGSAW